MKTFKKVLKAVVSIGTAGLMKALALSMFFVSLLSLNSYADDAKDLIEAALKGDTAGVKALLDKGADVNAKGKYDQTALILASENGHTQIVNLLLNKGADVNIQMAGSHFTALMMASENGHAAIVRDLLAKGADVNIKGAKCFTALFIASEKGHAAIVRELLAKGADVNIKVVSLFGKCSDNGETVLMAASKKGHAQIVKALLAKGADVNAKDKDGQTALMMASKFGHTEIAKLLRDKGADKTGMMDEGGNKLVYDIQKALVRLGYSTEHPNGKMNPTTADAIRDYQKWTRQKETGEASAGLLYQLLFPCQIRVINSDPIPEGGCKKPKEVAPGVYQMQVE